MGLNKWLHDEGLFGWNYAYLLRHPYTIIRELWCQVKWFIQRGQRGYSDRDTWNLASYMTSWLPEAIRSLKGHGTPIQVFVDLFGEDVDIAGLSPEKGDETHQRWFDILDAIAEGFEAHRKLNELIFMPNTQEYKDLEVKMKDGLTLFARYYWNLWD